MNVSYRWLRDLAPDLDLSPAGVGERLAMLGAPVEGIADVSEGLGDVVIGRVLEARRHPNSDRLTLCRVDGGAGEVSVVCGAPNVRAGAFYPFAPVGSVLPGDVRIKKVKLRGEVSEGMLCSARELRLGPDHEGILELVGDFQPGAPFVEAVGLMDFRLDVEVGPNRPDLLSHMGVARELVGEKNLRMPEIPGSGAVAVELVTGTGEVESGGAGIRIDDPDLCSRYLGAVIRGVEVGPSPEWLATRLRAAGARPINNVVDATNYVLLELGQPLHAFDLHRLAERRIVVRRAREGEVLETLDGVTRKLGTEMLMICDAVEPVAVAGVMGGARSEVSEGTEDVLLECALFHPPSIRATRRALGMSTDASYRFERGVDPAGMERALARAVEIILATAGGSLELPVLDAHPRPWEGLTVPLRPRRVDHVLGVSLGVERIGELLDPLGFEVGPPGDDGALRVAVPGFRSYDVRREIDLIEEVARTHGYDAFPDELAPFRPGTVPDDSLFRLEDTLRELMVGRGFLESRTTAFAPAAEGDVEIVNPVSAEEGRLRRSLLPSLLRSVERNFARGVRDVRLFELGTVFRKGPAGELPLESNHLAVVVTGRREPPHWSGVGGGAVDEWDLRGLLEAVVRRAGIEGWVLEPGAPADGLFDGALGYTVRRGDGSPAGGGARIRPDRVDAPAWAGDVWGIEVDLGTGTWEEQTPIFAALPAFPAVERDLALLVPEGLQAAAVGSLIETSAGTFLESVGIFDLYEGKGIPDGFRSIAFRLRFRSPERTLTDRDVDRATDRVVRRLREDLGVEARGTQD